MSAGRSERSAVVRPTWDDPVARWASEVVGGPAGRRLAVPAHPWWWAGNVLVLVGSVVVALGLLRYQNCRVDGWTTPDQFVHLCYSDVALLFDGTGGSVSGALGLDGGTGVAQPALTALLLAAVALLVPRLRELDARLTGTVAEGDPGTRVAFDLSVVLVALALAVTVLAVAAVAGRRPWDAGLVAWSPVVLLAGLVSVDLVGVALGVAAVWAWSRDRPWLAGLLLGLAVGARLHVVLVAVALVLLAARTRRWERVTRTLATAAVAWSLPNLLLLLLAPRAWLAPLQQWWSTEPAQAYGSVWFVAQLVLDSVGVQLPERLGPTAAVASLAAVGATVAAVAAWVLRSRVPPRLPVVVLVLLVGTLVVAKVVPVQASVWLLPWAALAVPRYRDHLWWWAAEAAYVVAVWQHLVSGTTPDRALPAGYYAVFLLLRLAAMGWLAWRAGQLAATPEADPVRLAAGGRDPAAGSGGIDEPPGPPGEPTGTLSDGRAVAATPAAGPSSVP